MEFEIMRWVNSFKNGPSKTCGRQHVKNLKLYGLPRQTISPQFFRACLLQILLGLFLNALSHISFFPKFMNYCSIFSNK